MLRPRSRFDRFWPLLAILVLVSPALGQGGAPSSNWRDRGLSSAPPPSAEAGGVDVGLGGTREPAVAVNPLDSRNVAMSSLFQYRVSVDGGGAWTAPMSNVVPAGYFQDGDPSLAFDHMGRLFYCYQGYHGASGGADEFVSQLNPTTGALIAGPFKISVSGTTGNYNDKCWIAADRWASSPFAGRLYTVWSEFPGGPTRALFSRSTDQGATWSTPLQLSIAAEGFPWPAHVAVAPNGDVYVSYHSQTGFNGIGEAGGNPDGTSGKVFVLRSTDGGVSFPQKTLAFGGAGGADLTFNVQSSPGTIPATDFWLQGSGQAWVLPDPHVAGKVYVVSADDSDNVHGVGDDGDIYLSTTSDFGASWTPGTRIDHGPGTSFQVMPTAAIDDQTGCILVAWYDNRDGGTNGAGNWLIQVYSTVSCDDGLSFQPDVKINDVSFDPDLGAPARFPGPPATLRIGEYIGVAAGGGDLYAVWCGNNGGVHQTITDSLLSAGSLTPYCYGDGSLVTSCPCSNFGAYRNGCANSVNASGAMLVTTGTPSLDTVVLTSSGERPTSLSIFIQGNVDAPAGATFGDGVRCASGTLKRLYVKNAVSGVVSAPQGVEPSIKLRSAALGDTILPGSPRFYQVFYRDPNPTFCPEPPGNTFNISNAFRILW